MHLSHCLWRKLVKSELINKPGARIRRVLLIRVILFTVSKVTNTLCHKYERPRIWRDMSNQMNTICLHFDSYQLAVCVLDLQDLRSILKYRCSRGDRSNLNAQLAWRNDPASPVQSDASHNI